jgi:chromosome segregation ATPase
MCPFAVRWPCDHERVFAGRKRLARIDRHLDRGDELMEGIREEFRLSREQRDRHQAAIEREFELTRAEFELNRREHQETRAAVQNLQQVCRVLVLRVEENTEALRDLREEVRAQTQAIMRVLDELRRLGPGGAAAAPS